MSKLTPWYPATVKPLRFGVYERRMTHGIGKYSFWNGAFWCGWSSGIEGAVENALYGPSNVQDKQWRGLTSAKEK